MSTNVAIQKNDSMPKEDSKPKHVNYLSAIEDPEIEERIDSIGTTLDEIKDMMGRAKRSQAWLKRMTELQYPAEDIKCARLRIIGRDHSMMRRLDNARMNLRRIRRRMFLKWNVKYNPHIEEMASRCHQLLQKHRRDRYDE